MAQTRMDLYVIKTIWHNPFVSFKMRNTSCPRSRTFMQASINNADCYEAWFFMQGS
ncbi:hypothetical protein ATG_09510 [Desulfurococcaceae archaeon AG1]|nr:hypothetical protein ATG_09510 [Desulfurococcaceae archaeon AG1]